jgi:selenocysteine lyase/cysteine desulfurase
VDGVHGFANQDLDVARLGCDFFATGTHKWLLGPRGTGFLWGRKDAWLDLRPTIPSFDPDAPQTRAAWMERKTLPPTEASFVSPGGFLAYEYLLAIPGAVELHREIRRDRVASRISENNAELLAAFRENAKKIAGVMNFRKRLMRCSVKSERWRPSPCRGEVPAAGLSTTALAERPHGMALQRDSVTGLRRAKPESVFCLLAFRDIGANANHAVCLSISV